MQRLKVFWLDHDALLTLLGLANISGWAKFTHDLPAGAKVVDIAYDWQHRAIGVRVEHDSFDIVEPAMPAPWADRLNVQVKPETPAEELEGRILALQRGEDDPIIRHASP